MFYNYPDHTLVYWRNEQSAQLPKAVEKLFSNSSNFNQITKQLLTYAIDPFEKKTHSFTICLTRV